MLSYDPFSIAAMENPDQFFDELLEDHPFYRLEQYNGWAIPRFEHCWQILQERDVFSIVEGPVFNDTINQCPFDYGRLKPSVPERSFSVWDAPAHPQIRKSLSPSFSPAAVAPLEEGIRTMCRQRFTESLDGGRMDIVADYAGLIALPNICVRIGMPCDDPDALFRKIQKATARAPGKSGFTEQGLALSAEIGEHIAICVAQRRAEIEAGAKDNGTTMDALLLYRYSDAELENQPLSDDAISTHMRTLMIGGAETVPKVIAAGILQLYRNPVQLQALRNDLSLCQSAFEEMMRFGGVLQHVGRTAIEDYEIDGHCIKAGQRVFCLIQAANRDPREFTEPNHFDISRDTKRSLALGTGRHHCIGAHLARLEGRVLLEEFIKAIPEYRIDEAAIKRQSSEFQVGYTSMPIQF
ncbi:cytochrome P450 [Halieaceae bacterium]|nr:cytochrome P450 [Halieaceae bacterium]